jgi:hypothetical protein
VPETDSQKIRRLCDSWIQAATGQGGIAIGQASEQHRLRNNEVRFHELDFDELRAATVGLAEVLLLQGMNTIVDADHHLLWAWCGEVLLGRGAPYAHQAEPEIAELATTALRASLVYAGPGTREAFDQMRAAQNLLQLSERELLSHSHVVLVYLSFPLLEAVTRRACPGYVNLRGEVQAVFPRLNGQNYAVRQRCSSIGDLVKLLNETVAGTDLRDDLWAILANIASVGGGTDPYRVLFDWRNSSLHGEVSLPAIGGTVLTLALRIALESIADDYETHRVAGLERAQREVGTAQVIGRWSPAPWSFYPPYP